MADGLKPKQKKCIELMLEGMKQKDIAVEIGVSEKTISLWKKDEVFCNAYDEAVKGALRFASAKALNKQIKLIGCGNEMVAHLAAKDILDRGGYKSEDKVALRGVSLPQIVDNVPKEASDVNG